MEEHQSDSIEDDSKQNPANKVIDPGPISDDISMQFTN